VPSKAVPPSIFQKSFSCPRCGAHADQGWFKLRPVAVSTDDGTPQLVTEAVLEKVRNYDPHSIEDADEYKATIKYFERIASKNIFIGSADWASTESEMINLHLSQCYSCKEFSVWHHDRVLFPHKTYEIEPNSDMAEDIQRDYNEARAILDLSPRGAAALLRLCIQKLCKQLGQPGKNINDDIGNLVKAGLDVRVQKILDTVRVIGNESVHPGVIDLRDDRETAAKLFELVNRIAYDTITHKKEVDALYDSLPERKRKDIERRDAAKK
jgi:hypothetical protein